MTKHLRLEEFNRGKWLILAILMVALVSVFCGRVALWASSSAAPPRFTRVGGDSANEDVVSPDAKVVSAETMALATFDEKIGGRVGVGTIFSTARLLRAWQWDEERSITGSHPYYGGTGRWPQSAPDVMHTALTLRSLRRVGIAQDDPYCQRALAFIRRCQVVDDSEVSGEAERRDRGGFSTGPIVGPAEHTPEMRLGSPNGVSTCLGLTSLLDAGVRPTDVRIEAAIRWLEEHYSLDAHPGMKRPQEGLYHYYYAFSKAMTALGRDRLRDSTGRTHFWRAELQRELSKRQNDDGSWTNAEESAEPVDRAPTTVTSLALLTLIQVRR